MFKLVGFFITTALILTSVSLGGDFRGNNWGDSPEEVIAVEGEPLSKISNGAALVFRYEKRLSGKKVRVRYCFAPGGKLAIATYYDERVRDLRGFLRWVDEIAASYGEPEKKDWVCTDDPRTVDEFSAGGPGGLAEAVKEGFFVLQYRWQTDTTIIDVMAIGRDSLVDTSLGYASSSCVKEYMKSIDEAPMKIVP
jgi:hypothetical protein